MMWNCVCKALIFVSTVWGLYGEGRGVAVGVPLAAGRHGQGFAEKFLALQKLLSAIFWFVKAAPEPVSRGRGGFCFTGLSGLPGLSRALVVLSDLPERLFPFPCRDLRKGLGML